MKKILPIIFIFVTVLLFFTPFFVQRFLPIPSDTITGLYYPFRDLYEKTNPNGIPFKNFLITDPVRQQYPWRNLSIMIEKNLYLPLWNPYNFSGTPLLANQQSAPFYLLNIVFFMQALFTFQIAWSILVILQPLLAGVFLYAYLRNSSLHPGACLLGAITFSFCGFCTAWMEWNTVVQTALWLPLILLSIDKLSISCTRLRIKMKTVFLWSVIFICALVSSFFAGHLQTFFYVFLISYAYFFARWIQYKRQKHFLFLCLLLTSCFLLLTAIQWIPTLQFINLSARNVDQNWHTAGWFIPWQNLLQFISPDFFGNPTTNNYWGVWNYGELIGYVGIFPLLISIYALFFRRDKKTLFYGSLFFLSLLFALPTFFAQLPFILAIPFLSTAQPTRLLFITDFSLAVLTALGFDYFLKNSLFPLRGKKGSSKDIFYVTGFFLILFACLWIVVFTNTKIHLLSADNLSIAKHNLVLPTVLFIISALLIIAGKNLEFFSKLFGKVPKSFSAKGTLILISCFVLLTTFDLFRFASKFETFAQSNYLYPNTKVTSYLQQHAGISRVMTTDSRILPPNFSIMYHIQSVDGYDPLYILRYGELIAASQRGKPDISPPFGFNRIITPHNYDSRLIDLLGVKYVVSLSDIANNKLKKVFQDGQTQIYENSQALPRAFLVSQVTSVDTKEEALTRLFAYSFDPSKQAVIEWGSGTRFPFPFSTGTISVTQYMENKIIIKTNTPGNAFLVLTDNNYPTWHASIDGKETKIFATDFAFRGIVIPRGNHIVDFSDRLF